MMKKKKKLTGISASLSESSSRSARKESASVAWNQTHNNKTLNVHTSKLKFETENVQLKHRKGR